VSSVWGQVEALLDRVEKPARYIDSEWGAVKKPDAAYRAALLYPDVYEIGMANQGLAILYAALNELPDVAAERVYLPWMDMSELMRADGVPLFTLETCTPVGECDLLGITLPYELTYSNILEALDLSGLPVRAADRDDSHPIVLAGGPCVYNPEPIAPFFDAILIGEGEDAAAEIVAAHRAAHDAGLSRAETLKALSVVPGVYVPSLYDTEVTPAGHSVVLGAREGAAFPVRKRVVADLGAHRAPICPVVPFMDVVHDRVGVEVLRGCTRGCRFCQAGMVYRPVRERTADAIVRDAVAALSCTGYDEVSLTSLSTTDHSQLSEVLRRLKRRLVTPPDQRGSVRVAVSVSTLVPKADTPFQWEGQIPLQEVWRRQSVLRDSMPRKGIDLSWHDAEVSQLEGAMARGGREVADAIEIAWRDGARFDAWTERFSLARWTAAFEKAGLDLPTSAARSFERDDVLPWSHISAGVSSAYLWKEYERSLTGAVTQDCSFDSCTACGVCGDAGLGVEIVLGGESRGGR